VSAPPSEGRTAPSKDLVLTLATAIVVVALAGAIWSLTQANWLETLGAMAAAAVGALLYRWRWPHRRRVTR
jgi:hypothetical protein